MVGYVIVAVVAFVAGSFVERLISHPLHAAVLDVRDEAEQAHLAALRLETDIKSFIAKVRKKL